MAVTVGGTSITFNDGTTQSTAFGGVSGIKYVQFGSSGTFTVPNGVTTLRVLVAGGGGGGSGLQGYYGRYMAGGNGAYAEALIDVTPGQQIAVTVGSGGSGGTGSYSAGATGGATGGTSSFGSYITCTGGQGGYYNTSGIYQGTNGTVTLSGVKRVKRSGWTFLGMAGAGGESNCGAGGAGAGAGGASGNNGAAGISDGPGANSAASTGTAGTNGGAGIEGVNSNGGAASGGYAGGGGGGGGAVHIFY